VPPLQRDPKRGAGPGTIPRKLAAVPPLSLANERRTDSPALKPWRQDIERSIPGRTYVSAKRRHVSEEWPGSWSSATRGRAPAASPFSWWPVIPP